MSSPDAILIVIAVGTFAIGHKMLAEYRRNEKLLKQQNFHYLAKPRKRQASFLKSLVPQLRRRNSKGVPA